MLDAEKVQMKKIQETREKKLAEEARERRRREIEDENREDRNSSAENFEEDAEEELDGEEEDDELEEDDEDEEEDFIDPSNRDGEPRAISNITIREELRRAIKDATSECTKEERINLKLQAFIVQMKRRNKHSTERVNEFNMSDVKYANTLARVHQKQLELKQTQEKHERMTEQTKENLNEKISRCNELRSTFLELKREVAKKAAYSKADKKISDEQIAEWERLELAKSREVSLRLILATKIKT